MLLEELHRLVAQGESENLEFIEKWGTGTTNIIKRCKENKNPKPIWEVQEQSVITVFLPSAFFLTGKLLKESSEVVEARPVSLEVEILELLRTEASSRTEIARSLGHKRISGGLKKALYALLRDRKIACTIPEKPGSRFQRYKAAARD